MLSLTADALSSTIADPFRAHLIALLSVYELGPSPSPPTPRYDGPADWQTDSILRSLATIAKRMLVAEEALQNSEDTKPINPAAGSSSSQPSAAAIDSSTPIDRPAQAASTSLDGLQSSFDCPITAAIGSTSADDGSQRQLPSNSNHIHCPTCGRSMPINDPLFLIPPTTNVSTKDSPLSEGSSLVASMSPLAVAPFESGMSPVEELRLLKAQVSDVVRVCNAVARGDLTQKITVPVQGVVMVQLKDVVNNMVDKLELVANVVTRVSQEVGKEGKFGGQPPVPDAEGTWKEVTGAVNDLAANLTLQVRSISKVTKAIALGDLSKKIEVEARGEMLDLKNTVNGMVVRFRTLTAQVIQVTAGLGSQGELDEHSYARDAEGVWYELASNVNRMRSTLTDQIRSIDRVVNAVVRGDLTQKVQLSTEGEMSVLKASVNSMVDHLSEIASEVTRVVLEVDAHGILGGQAKVEGVQGVWADLTQNVNHMASNLTNQVRSIFEVTKAVAMGDLDKRVEVEAQGEMLELKMAVNTMVARLSVVADEVTQVSSDIGAMGFLGGQANVPDAQGDWKRLVDAFNAMAHNVTFQVRLISVATVAVARGDLTQRVTGVTFPGEMRQLVNIVNDMIDELANFCTEAKRVTKDVKVDYTSVSSVMGVWQELSLTINAMAEKMSRGGARN